MVVFAHAGGIPEMLSMLLPAGSFWLFYRLTRGRREAADQANQVANQAAGKEVARSADAPSGAAPED